MAAMRLAQLWASKSRLKRKVWRVWRVFLKHVGIIWHPLGKTTSKILQKKIRACHLQSERCKLPQSKMKNRLQV